jgi:hypothetical protein
MAALAIVFCHITLFSSIGTAGAIGRVGGALSVGVPVFFALSGFVIYAPFVAARADRTALLDPALAADDRFRARPGLLGRLVALLRIRLDLLALDLPVRGSEGLARPTTGMVVVHRDDLLPRRSDMGSRGGAAWPYDAR